MFMKNAIDNYDDNGEIGKNGESSNKDNMGFEWRFIKAYRHWKVQLSIANGDRSIVDNDNPLFHWLTYDVSP